jgi:hypothetical protein
MELSFLMPNSGPMDSYGFRMFYFISNYIRIIYASCVDNKISYSNPPAKQVG